MDPQSHAPYDWHTRFVQQAGWTSDLRRYLYQKVGINQALRVLDVGCGTGALLPELLDQAPGRVYGLDISADHLSEAARNSKGALLLQADAHLPPFARASFDLVLCHYLLLWLADPSAALGFLIRLLRPEGALLVLAEPDYGGRIDHPQPLSILGAWQRQSLESQGADPLMGRKIPGLLVQAGLEQVESGVIGAQWSGAPSPDDLRVEWEVLEHDLLRKQDEVLQDIKQKLDQLRDWEIRAWQTGERVLFVPTFYAWGKAPGRTGNQAWTG
jgi:SAM-dependent methyltransferase